MKILMKRAGATADGSGEAEEKDPRPVERVEESRFFPASGDGFDGVEGSGSSGRKENTRIDGVEGEPVRGGAWTIATVARKSGIKKNDKMCR